MLATQERFADRRPIAFFVLLYIGMMLVYVATGAAAQIYHLDTLTQGLLATGTLTAVALVLIARLRWARETGLNWVQSPKLLLLCWLPLLIALRPLLNGIKVTDLSQILLIGGFSLLVGFVEEAFFRGLFMRALRSFGQFHEIFWPAVLFGLSHALNMMDGQGSVLTAAQISGAAAVGFLFAVLRLRLRSIWPLVIIHALIDFVSFLSDGGVRAVQEVSPSALIEPAVYTVAMVAYGIYLLRSLSSQGEAGAR